jgi:non-specific serine/threonine protein kinase/serine/threonine-protein kinase
VAVATAAALVLPTLTVSLAVQVRQVAAERDRANREAKVSRRAADFMASMFRVADPSEARGNTITAREILDRATAEVDTALSGDPVLQAQMMDTMGSVYTNLGLYPKAHALLEAALEKRRRVLGAEAPDTLASMRGLGEVLFFEGRYPDAERLLREAIALQRRVLGPEHPDTALSMAVLTRALRAQAKLAEAEQLQRETLAIQLRVLGPENPNTLRSMSGLAVVSQEVVHAALRSRVMGAAPPMPAWGRRSL